MSQKSASELTKRTPRIVGREEELERLRQCLHARGERHFVYYWADGGLGKTRLLEELLRMVEDAGPGFYRTDIIDLFHTDTHSTSDVERAILDFCRQEYRTIKQMAEALARKPSALQKNYVIIAHEPISSS